MERHNENFQSLTATQPPVAEALTKYQTSRQAKSIWGAQRVTPFNIAKGNTCLFLISPEQRKFCALMIAAMKHLRNLMHELHHQTRDKRIGMDAKDSVRRTPHGQLMDRPDGTPLIFRNKPTLATNMMQQVFAILLGGKPTSDNDLTLENRFVIGSHISGDPTDESYEALTPEMADTYHNNRILQKVSGWCFKSTNEFVSISLTDNHSNKWARIASLATTSFTLKLMLLQQQAQRGEPKTCLKKS